MPLIYDLGEFVHYWNLHRGGFAQIDLEAIRDSPDDNEHRHSLLSDSERRFPYFNDMQHQQGLRPRYSEYPKYFVRY